MALPKKVRNAGIVVAIIGAIAAVRNRRKKYATVEDSSKSGQHFAAPDTDSSAPSAGLGRRAYSAN